MKRQLGLVTFIALSSILLTGASSPTTCNTNEHIGPSDGEVIGIGVAIVAVVVVGTVVLIEVNKSHHEIRGCVSLGPGGLQVENESDHHVYSLTGVSASVKPGDIVKVKGTKEKWQKGSTANREFQVAKMSRDYGPCKVPAAQP